MTHDATRRDDAIRRFWEIAHDGDFCTDPAAFVALLETLTANDCRVSFDGSFCSIDVDGGVATLARQRGDNPLRALAAAAFEVVLEEQR